jgi:hypothetical protein
MTLGNREDTRRTQLGRGYGPVARQLWDGGPTTVHLDHLKCHVFECGGGGGAYFKEQKNTNERKPSSNIHSYGVDGVVINQGGT